MTFSSCWESILRTFFGWFLVKLWRPHTVFFTPKNGSWGIDGFRFRLFFVRKWQSDASLPLFFTSIWLDFYFLSAIRFFEKIGGLGWVRVDKTVFFFKPLDKRKGWKVGTRGEIFWDWDPIQSIHADGSGVHDDFWKKRSPCELPSVVGGLPSLPSGKLTRQTRLFPVETTSSNRPSSQF